MTTAVTAKSAQTGWPEACIWSRNQVSGQITSEIAEPIRTKSSPNSHNSGPMTAVAAPARISALPALAKLSANPDSRIADQLTPKPLTPPPWSRKNATTGKARKNREALRLLAGRRGIRSGNSRMAPSRKVRLTRQRSGCG